MCSETGVHWIGATTTHPPGTRSRHLMKATHVAGEASKSGMSERCEGPRSGKFPLVIANPRRKRKKRLMLAANPARFQRSPSSPLTPARRRDTDAETANLQEPKS